MTTICFLTGCFHAILVRSPASNGGGGPMTSPPNFRSRPDVVLRKCAREPVRQKKVPH